MKWILLLIVLVVIAAMVLSVYRRTNRLNRAGAAETAEAARAAAAIDAAAGVPPIIDPITVGAQNDLDQPVFADRDQLVGDQQAGDQQAGDQHRRSKRPSGAQTKSLRARRGSTRSRAYRSPNR